jgi:Serine dehydrogenase proteinase
VARAERVDLIRQIESLRRSRVLVYFCGDHPMRGAQIHDDALRPMYDHLRAIDGNFPENPRKLDLYLYSLGGLMEAPWKIIMTLREFTDELRVIVPYKAYSAATMIALGTDKICMTRKAELSPIDPTLQLQAPPDQPGGFVLRDLGVEDVTAYVSFLRNRAGLTDQSALAGVIGALADSLTPPLLGRVERVYSHIRLVARKLLSLCQPPMEDTRVTAVIEALTEKSYAHGHGTDIPHRLSHVHE